MSATMTIFACASRLDWRLQARKQASKEVRESLKAHGWTGMGDGCQHFQHHHGKLYRHLRQLETYITCNMLLVRTYGKEQQWYSVQAQHSAIPNTKT